MEDFLFLIIGRLRFYLCKDNYSAVDCFQNKGTRETPQSLKRIGSRTSTLDKSWSNNPDIVMNNVHKLTEIEIMNLLQKVVTLPEKRLEKMLKTQKKEDPEFIRNLIERLPHFLTATLVQIVKVCGRHSQIMQKSEIWDYLELEFLKRSDKLNNQHLADVLFAFACAGKGSEKFFNLMGDTITNSPIEFEENHLFKFLKSYAQMNYGSPLLYSHLSMKLQELKDYLSITRMAEICGQFAKSTNSDLGGFGFYEFVENAVKQEMQHNRLHFTEGSKVIECLFRWNIGSSDFQERLEEYLTKKIEHERIPELLSISKAIYDPKYIIKHSQLNEDL